VSEHTNGGPQPNPDPFGGKQQWFKPSQKAIAGPIRYISSMPSKGVRSKLIEAMNYWLHVPGESVETIKHTIDLLHNASLILDDIEDNSPLRRGKVATHSIFGYAQSINSSNFMLLQAMQEAAKLSNKDALQIVLDDVENLFLGQSWDLYWKYNLICPSVEEYLNMVDNKTGCMFRLLVRLMQGESERTTVFDFDRLTLLFGRFFQIRDDYMNLSSNEYSDQKGLCEDLDEGKFSYPILHCLEHHPEFKDYIIGVFRQRPVILAHDSQKLPKECKINIVEQLRRFGTFEACRSYLIEMEASLEAEIAKLEHATGETNPVLRLILARLSLRKMAEG
jgi:ophiobolin F synthase